MSLFARLAAVIVGLVLAGTLLTTVILVRVADEELLRARSSDLESAAEVAQTRFVGRNDEVLRNVAFLAGTPSVQGLVRAGAHDGIDPTDGSTAQQWRDRLALVFEQLLANQPYYLQVRFVGRADGGRELVRVERRATDGAIHRTAEDALQRKANEPYFEATLALATGEIFTSPINLNREHGQIVVPHVPVYRVATPVGASGAPHFGIIIINVDARRSLRELTFGSSSQALVVRSDGHYLLHPEPERAFGFDLGRPATGEQDFPLAAPVFRGDEPLLTTYDETRRRLITARKLRLATGEAPATLIMSRQHASVPLRAIAPLVAPVVLMGILSMLVGLGVARWLIRPLARLTDAVDLMVDGESGFEVPEGLSPEVRVLAEALDHSIDALRARDRLEASNRELRQFAYLASHDLREPMRTISNYLELLEEDYGNIIDEDGHEFIRFMRRSSVRMTTLIDGLLEHARLGSGAKAVRVDTRQLLDEVIDDLTASIDDANASISVSNDLPELRGYRLELRLLFQNLLSNAIKFRREGVSPKIRVDASSHDEGTWQFCVTDNGPGIPADKRDRVFEIFQRLHTQESAEGSGIGLAHCRKIVSLHRGRMWVEDAPEGVGARFCFTLREVES